jgi:RimJ/RimL family protein N-acetyltransferase
MSIHEQRRKIRRLLDDSSAADAPTAYYALFHDPARSQLFTHTDDKARATGFVGVFRTGIDLFRPVVALRCGEAQTAADLLAQALTPDRPYILFASLNQRPLVGGSLRILSQRELTICQLDARRFQPELNVLARNDTAPDGTPRSTIESNGQRAIAGVNWQSPAFAEIWAHVDPGARQRGWGASVVKAVTQSIIQGGRIPLYLVEPANTASRALAEAVGFVDTGGRQLYADVVYLGHPGKRHA